MSGSPAPRRWRRGRRWLAAIAVLTSAFAGAACGGGGEPAAQPGEAADGPITIGIAQPFLNEPWQQAQNASAQWAAEQLASRDVTVQIVDADNNVQTQIQQINTFILQGVDALLVAPVSASQVNGAIDKAVAAGIPTLVYATGPVTTDTAVQLAFDFQAEQQKTATHIFEQLGGSGNVLEVRGAAGAGADEKFHAGNLDALRDFPGITVVGEVYGQWNEAKAQDEVSKILPSLPQVDAVITQGGDVYGTIQAFLAAGRPAPLAVFGNRPQELKWWSDNLTSYPATYSDSTNPGIGSLAVNLGYLMTQGHRYASNLSGGPWLQIGPADLPRYLGSDTQPSSNFTLEQTEQLYAANRQG